LDSPILALTIEALPPFGQKMVFAGFMEIRRQWLGATANQATP
jgi:hypothetical protein